MTWDKPRSWQTKLCRDVPEVYPFHFRFWLAFCGHESWLEALKACWKCARSDALGITNSKFATLAFFLAFLINFRRFAPKCSGCDLTFKPTDMVRKARDHFFHVSCFVCVICHRQLMTGDQLFIINGHLFVCKEDCFAGSRFQNGNHFSGMFFPQLQQTTRVLLLLQGQY